MENVIRMKIKAILLSLLFGVAAPSVQAIGINGVDMDGYGGVYDIVGPGIADGNYWWMCIEPNGSSGADVGDGFIADALSFLDGWDQQNQERLSFYTTEPVGNPGQYYTTAIPMQVRVMEYVLDTYLPWNLVGPSGRFLEQSSNSTLYGSDTDFYNAFFTIQNFLAETYGKGNKVDFTDMSEYTFFAGNAGDVDAIAARLALFNAILADVDNKATTDPNFFLNYVVQGTYIIANSYFSESDPQNRQDALIIVAPVPEPSGALLIACAGILVMFRRFRRLA